MHEIRKSVVPETFGATCHLLGELLVTEVRWTENISPHGESSRVPALRLYSGRRFNSNGIADAAVASAQLSSQNCCMRTCSGVLLSMRL